MNVDFMIMAAVHIYFYKISIPYSSQIADTRSIREGFTNSMYALYTISKYQLA